MGETLTETSELGSETQMQNSPKQTPDGTDDVQSPEDRIANSEDMEHSSTGSPKVNGEEKTEEEEIKELMMRGDTAIVFPEPVDKDGLSLATGKVVHLLMLK